MKDYILSQANTMKKINDLTLPGEIVVFGSTYMASFPIYELINKCTLENAIYNRSIKGLTIQEALEILDDCVISIHPSKVFVALGEEDANSPNAIKDYSLLVSELRTKLPKSTIYLIRLNGSDAYSNSFNENITHLCSVNDIRQIDLISKSTSEAALYKAQFKQLSTFFRKKPITMCDAFISARI